MIGTMGWEEIGHNLFQDTIFAFAGGRKTMKTLNQDRLQTAWF